MMMDDALPPIFEAITKVTYADLRELAERVIQEVPAYDNDTDKTMAALYRVAQTHMDNLEEEGE